MKPGYGVCIPQGPRDGSRSGWRAASARFLHEGDYMIRRVGTTSTLNMLRALKLFHTVIWIFFAGCIFAIPVLAWTGRYAEASVFCGIVLIEVLVLLFNRWSCPLTRIAARYTDDRRENFDIYLPEWLARYNKVIFGVLYAAGVLATLVSWAGLLG